MKIDRRSFISLGVGATAGIALSPIPWKLTDDLSIWSQNWPWTPVPPDGAITYEKTTCALCAGGCGLLVRKVDDRVVKVEGMPGHPVNDGGVCILGLAAPQLLYSPTRIDAPYKKDGSGWTKISWEEAIQLAVEKIGEPIRKNRPEAIACIAGSDQGTVANLFGRLMMALKSPNFFRPASFLDSYEIAFRKMHGKPAMAGFDVEQADYILSFGSGLLDGWGSPVRMYRANSNLKERRGRIVQVEPCLSNTAAKADEWVPVKPGGEMHLALALAHVIVKENLYRGNFIENCTEHFEEFKKLVLDRFAPESVAEATGIKADRIETLARAFADNGRKSIALCGRGKGRKPSGLGETMAVHALNALVGNINQPGGVWTVPSAEYIRWPSAQQAGVAERIDGAQTGEFADTRYLPHRLPEIIHSGKGGGIEVMLTAADVNPRFSMADAASVQKAFDRIPFVISFATFWDETAAQANLILPNHFFLERMEDVPVQAGISHPLVGLTRPVVEPLLQTAHTGDVILEIARRLPGAANYFPWRNYRQCLRETMGSAWNDLSRQGYRVDAGYRPPSWEESFNDASGRFDWMPLIAAADKTIEPDGSPSAFPLILIPKDSIRIGADAVGTPPFLMKTLPDTVLQATTDLVVEINPKTAADMGLVEGQKAVLSTPKGAANVRVHLFEGIMPGVAVMPAGLGHTAYDDYLSGKGVNINTLMGPTEDPVSGLDVAWGIRAKLTGA